MLHDEFQGLVLDVNWHPFKVVQVDGLPIYQLSENHERLEKLRAYEEEGEAAIVAVIVAAERELIEFNASGCYKISKIWNFDEYREATAR